MKGFMIVLHDMLAMQVVGRLCDEVHQISCCVYNHHTPHINSSYGGAISTSHTQSIHLHAHVPEYMHEHNSTKQCIRWACKTQQWQDLVTWCHPLWSNNAQLGVSYMYLLQLGRLEKYEWSSYGYVTMFEVRNFPVWSQQYNSKVKLNGCPQWWEASFRITEIILVK